MANGSLYMQTSQQEFHSAIIKENISTEGGEKSYEQSTLAALILSTYISHRSNGIIDSDRHKTPLVQNISGHVQ